MTRIANFLNSRLSLEIFESLIERDNASISAIIFNIPQSTQPKYKNQVSQILSGRGKDIDLLQSKKSLWDRVEFLKCLNSELFGISFLLAKIFPRAIVDSFNLKLLKLYALLSLICHDVAPVFWSLIKELPQEEIE